MKAEKIWMRRLALRWARKLVDLLDDCLHAEEVRFRTQMAEISPIRPESGEGEKRKGVNLSGDALPSFEEWQATHARAALCGRVSPHTPHTRRRQRLTANAFDLRFVR